jgi:hypothetical protein
LTQTNSNEQQQQWQPLQTKATIHKPATAATNRGIFAWVGTQKSQQEKMKTLFSEENFGESFAAEVVVA